VSLDKVLQALNEMPYVYFCYVKERVVLPVEVGEHTMKVSKNKKTGLLEVLFGEKRFCFDWNETEGKWIHPQNGYVRH
jgi:hypothetical protein